ncbi:MAG: FkbM family methyltransferase [Pseudomonadota bacterium]
MGANIGVFSFLAAERVGPAGAIIAFEPEPKNIACFQRTLSGVARAVTLQQVAVGATDGTMRFDRRGGACIGSAGGCCARPAIVVPPLLAARFPPTPRFRRWPATCSQRRRPEPSAGPPHL